MQQIRRKGMQLIAARRHNDHSLTKETKEKNPLATHTHTQIQKQSVT